MAATPHKVVEAEGHLIDSQILNTIFDTVIERGGQFEVLHFEIGRTNDDFSRLKLKVSAPTEEALQRLLEELMPLGCRAVEEQDALLQRRRPRRRGAGRLLLDDEPAHRGPHRRRLACRSSASAWMRSWSSKARRREPSAASSARSRSATASSAG